MNSAAAALLDKEVPMNTSVTGLPGVALFLLLAAGCSPHHLVILTPDPDGHVGKAEVITAGGRQLLEKPGGMTTVTSRMSAPSPASVASPGFIAATFADVIAIEPAAHETFILFFHTSTTTLVSESRETFTSILDAIKRRKAVSISISGHTDSSGSFQLNDALARNRAEAVRDLLIQNGVNARRLTISSHGKGNQLVPTSDGVAEPRNRRVEVIVR
jgi:outer membrane protein OmpA-like peptidoglycan-associated protein